MRYTRFNSFYEALKRLENPEIALAALQRIMQKSLIISISSKPI